MRRQALILGATALLLLAGCAVGPQSTTDNLRDLDARVERIREFIGEEMYGPGGLVILDVAHRALREKWARGEGTLVGIEDLWAHSLQEGLILFNQPERRWARTTAEETADMIGQTTVGPWQMTIWNIRDIYGPPYGVDPAWSNAEINAFCREHPEIQAKMITDYIQLSYDDYGRRSPYAIQRYFWLAAYVKGEIGQSDDWTRSPVAHPPEGGTWQDLTPEMMADTGFYGKQVLLGTRHTDTGVLFWLWVTGDTDAIRDALRIWRDQRHLIFVGDDDQEAYELTDEPGGFAVSPDDVIYFEEFPEIQEGIRAIIREVAEEPRP